LYTKYGLCHQKERKIIIPNKLRFFASDIGRGEGLVTFRPWQEKMVF